MHNIAFETETYTIKCGLNKFCRRNNQIISAITNDVLEISELMVEASILFNFHYSKLCENSQLIVDKPNFLMFFYQLQGKKDLDPEYEDLRNTYLADRSLYNGKHRTYLIQNAAKTLETSVKNNIIVNMAARVKKYFKLKFPLLDKKSLNDVLKCLFEKQSGSLPNNIYLEEFRREFNLDGSFTFEHLEKRWWEYINFLFSLLQCCKI